MDLSALIRSIPDYPKPGILFRDITTLLKDPRGFGELIDRLAVRYASHGVKKLAGIESRGFIIGAALATRLGAGFVPIRKLGKLPAPTIRRGYELEYGSDHVEVHVDAIGPGEKVLLVDDLIATGGTAEAAAQLIRDAGGHIIECAFVIELPDLGGRARLESLGFGVHAVMTFPGH
jgi:adenine phosphoribosyltransferase